MLTLRSLSSPILYLFVVIVVVVAKVSFFGRLFLLWWAFDEKQIAAADKKVEDVKIDQFKIALFGATPCSTLFTDRSRRK
jgi:hypothetical protein